MAIDSSIYQNIRPIETPNLIDSATKAYTLKHLALQSTAQDRANADTEATRAAFAKNIGADGKLNQAGVLSDLAKTSPTAMMQLQEHFNKTGKDEGEAYKTQAEAFQKRASIAANAIDYVMKLPPELQEKGYNDMVAHLVNSSVAKPNQFPAYSPETLKSLSLRAQQYMGQNSADYLGNKKTKAEIDHINAETGKVANGKPLATEQSDKLANHKAAMGLVGDLRAALTANQGELGPLAGRVAAVNPYNQRGQALQALLKKATQVIGKSLEGGKMTDKDYAKYEKMLPTQADTPATAADKLDQLERLIATQQNADLDTYQRTGLDVSKFSPFALKEIGITKGKRSGGKNGEAVAGELDAEDKQAILWAQNNRGDRRALEILKLHGLK